VDAFAAGHPSASLRTSFLEISGWFTFVHLRHRKRSGSKINCRGLWSTSRFHLSRRPQRPL